MKANNLTRNTRHTGTLLVRLYGSTPCYSLYMTLKKSKPKHTRPRYDWRPIAAALRADPGEWYKLDDTHPNVTAWGIRHGQPRAFEPAGAFDAVVNAKGTWLCFLGEPVVPWDYAGLLGDGRDPRAFDELERA